MARRVGPSESSREVKTIVTAVGPTQSLFRAKNGRTATFYLDPDPTAAPPASTTGLTLADVRTYPAGTAYPGSTVTVDAVSQLPLVQFPDGTPYGPDTLIVQCDGGPPWRVYAREDDRIDALEAGGAGDALLLHKAGAENVTGVKTFIASPVVPTPTTAQQAANRAYVDGYANGRKSVVNVTDSAYGAVSDAFFVDKKTIDGNFGLASAIPLNVSTFGKAFKDAACTQSATDNTNAFRLAWDALMTAGITSFERFGNPGYNAGYRALRKEFHIPAGAYYIADAASLFSTTRAAPPSVQRGVTISGAGKGNTILYVRITGSTSIDSLFYDNNSFRDMTIRDLTIVGTTGNEQIFYHSSGGNAKRYYLESVELRDYRMCIEIAGVANADRWTCVHVDADTSVAGAIFYKNPSNTQAVDNEFFNPSILHYNGGTLFDVGSGNVHLYGGSYSMLGSAANGAAGTMFKTGTLHSLQLMPAIASYSGSFELHDDAVFCDLSGSKAVFYEANPTLVNPTAPYHVILRNRGSFEYYGGYLEDLAFATSVNVTGSYFASERSEIIIKNSILQNPNLLSQRFSRFTDAGNGLTTPIDLTSAYTGSSGIPRIFVDGCRTAAVNMTQMLTVAPNGSPFATRGYATRATPVQLVYSSGAGAHTSGLPALGASPTPVIVIPLHCELRRIIISKQEGTGAGTWQVADGNGTVLCTLTATSGETFKFASTELRRRAITTNDATLTLTATSGSAAVGYFSVEYV